MEKHNDNWNVVAVHVGGKYRNVGWHSVCSNGGILMVMPWNKHKQNAKDMAWLVRASFEAAWVGAGGDPALWRDEWKNSQNRAVLLRMGYIDDKDGYR